MEDYATANPRQSVPRRHRTSHTQLITAISRGNIKYSLSLIKRRIINVDVQEESSGRTALMVAAELGNVEVLEALLRQRCLVDIEDFRLRTALFYAMRAPNSVEVIELLLSKTADPVHMDRSRITPLDIAVEKNMVETAKLMIERQPRCLSIFVERCQEADDVNCNYVQKVRQLVDWGADVSGEDYGRWTPLHLAAEQGCCAVAKILLRHDANIEQTTNKGKTPLHIAAESARSAMVSYLLVAGASLIARSNRGHTAVYLACFQGHDETADLLLQKAALEDELRVDNNGGLSLLRVAARRGCVKVIQRIICGLGMGDSFQRMLEEKVQGRTVTFDAIKCGQGFASRLLLTKGGTVEGYDHLENNALHLAAERGLTEVFQLLLDQQVADLDVTNKQGQTPIHLACMNRHEDIVTIILKHSARNMDPNLSTEGWSPLHWAAYQNRIDIVRLLVRSGVDVNTMSHDGKSANDLVQGVAPVSIEMRGWLETNIGDTSAEVVPDMTRPVRQARVARVCENMKVYMAQFYEEKTVEKTCFTVENVVYQHGPNYILSGVMRDPGLDGPSQSRWIHLPTNNIEWVKDLAQTIYFDRHRTIEAERTEDERILDGDRCWEIRQCSIAHHRVQEFIKQCFIASHRSLPSIHQSFFKYYQQHNSDIPAFAAGGYKVAFSMPYFSFTALKYQKELGNVVPTGVASPGHALDEIGNTAEFTRRYWQKETLKVYPKAYDLMFQSSRTLDEYYYGTVPGITRRNTDQVLYRRQKNERDENERFICVVNQIWLLVVDDDTVVTCFPRQWDDNSADLRKLISDRFLVSQPRILTLPTLIHGIISACIEESIGCHVGTTKETLIQAFAGEIARLADEEVSLFRGFKDNMKLPMEKRMLTREISKEMDLLEDIKDVQDELNIIRTVVKRQETVAGDAFASIGHVKEADMRGSETDSDAMSNHKDTLEEMATSCFQHIGLLVDEIDRLLKNAEQVYKNVNLLLELRQKQANLEEAVWSREASVNAAIQAKATSQQGRTVLVFTVVTIIFLPISFLSSLFALDVTIFPHNDEGDLVYEPSWLFSRLVGVTIALSVPLIVLAFSVNHATALLPTFSSKRTEESIVGDVQDGTVTAMVEEATGNKMGTRGGLARVRRWQREKSQIPLGGNEEAV